ncbi:MAG: DUF3052 domain-containing protein [Actinomycetaceae bacterium]|nr:DUF3052 domain-containing protein [Arcanobacterium sp.]MDD7504757.1 DUF3052 domain-containing protein [Actinomycetaceae bacterium]
MSGALTGEQFGFKKGDVIQEFGYDEDVDFELRDAVMDTIGEDLEDEDFRGVADGILAWWRSDDGDVDDLADFLVDCARSLEDGAGVIWCLVPSAHSQYHVSTADVTEAAKVAGQSVTTTVRVGDDWTAMRITSRGR